MQDDWYDGVKTLKSAGLAGTLQLVDSLVAPLSIVNALIVAIAAQKEKELSKTFANLERIWEEYDVYEKRVDG